MRYLPHTPDDIAEMLALIGVGSLDDLLRPIPGDCRLKEPLKLPEAMSEWELKRHMETLSQGMAISPDYQIYLGAGSYEHHIPAAVDALADRSEFSTAYTPYQPELSQGTLQAVYEFQSLCCRLLKMEVATASHYDGASALAEAALIALKRTRRTKIAISRLCHPRHRQVLATYLRPSGCEIVELPYSEDGRTTLTEIKKHPDMAAVIIQSPNFFGTIEDLAEARAEITDPKTMFIVSFTEPLAYGLLKAPGEFQADLAVGDGQSLGIPQAYGGPGLGIMTAKKEFTRALPGRLVGRTVDQHGRDGFVLTLAAREQHIRREKASSNICSNNNLTAIRAAIYLAALGGRGLRELAALNHAKCRFLQKIMAEAAIDLSFSGPNFNEFVIDLGPDSERVYEALLNKKLLCGMPLKGFYPELAHHYLICVTEVKERADLELLVEEIKRCRI